MAAWRLRGPRGIRCGSVKKQKSPETVVVLLLTILGGCAPQVEEDPPDFGDEETVRSSCEAWCATDHLCCEPVGPDRECSTWKLDEATCIADCVGSQAEWSFTEECRDDFYANVHCAGALTCEEYVEYFDGTPGHACEAEKEARFEMVNKGCFGT